jgi:hypothetical protein
MKRCSPGFPFRRGDLVLTRRGRVEAEQLPVQRDGVAGVGVLLADGADGPFRFELQWLRAERSLTAREDGFAPAAEQLIGEEQRRAASAPAPPPPPPPPPPPQLLPPPAGAAGGGGGREGAEARRVALLRKHREQLAEARLEKPA